jgi:dephospho-CoA kinase
MPLFYITGPAGSGKSALCKELRERGCMAYDEDDDGIGSAHSKHTLKPVNIPPNKERSEDWFSLHEWSLLAAAKTRLKELAVGRDVFLFGNSLKGNDISKLVDKIFYLQIDDATIKHRLTARVDNDYGKSKNEFVMVLRRKQADEKLIMQFQPIIIDASLPVHAIASDILHNISG